LAPEPNRANDQQNPQVASNSEAHVMGAVENIDHAAAIEVIPKQAACAEDKIGPPSSVETFVQHDKDEPNASDAHKPPSAVDDRVSVNEIHGEQSVSNPNPQDVDVDPSLDAVDGNPTIIDTMIVREAADLTKDDRVSNDVNGNELKQSESSGTYRDASETDVESDPRKLLKLLLRQLDKKEI